MRLVADESLDGPLIERLRSDGHEVISIAETQPGIPDIDVLAISRQEHPILLTLDKDFGELIYRLALNHVGVLLFRSEGLDAKEKADSLSKIVSERGAELPGMFPVLTKDSLRIRKPFPRHT